MVTNQLINEENRKHLAPYDSENESYIPKTKLELRMSGAQSLSLLEARKAFLSKSPFNFVTLTRNQVSATKSQGAGHRLRCS